MAYLNIAGILQKRSALVLGGNGSISSREKVKRISSSNPTLSSYISSASALAFLKNSISVKVSDAFQLRFGEREISIRKDSRIRYYHTNPIIECRAGVEAGHVEILFLRNWLIIFSRAQNLHITKPVLGTRK